MPVKLVSFSYVELICLMTHRALHPTPPLTHPNTNKHMDSLIHVAINVHCCDTFAETQKTTKHVAGGPCIFTAS